MDFLTYIWIGASLWSIDILCDPKLHKEVVEHDPIPYVYVSVLGILGWPIFLLVRSYQLLQFVFNLFH